MRAQLDRMKQRFAFVKHIRGEGLVYGVEMDSSERAVQCVLEAYRSTNNQGVHFLGPLSGSVLRVSPPLVITESELNEAFVRLESAWTRI